MMSCSLPIVPVLPSLPSLAAATTQDFPIHIGIKDIVLANIQIFRSRIFSTKSVELSGIRCLCIRRTGAQRHRITYNLVAAAFVKFRSIENHESMEMNPPTFKGKS
ncbi:hypothetical protein ABEB36_009147 [Hypothenemus hampei]|uniref:Secreted protein n=1 Tax=Hypothenemus hampei TaxID=57062 RepID=A0ABD1EPA3_HYPHA